jgi:hypothetical protein
MSVTKGCRLFKCLGATWSEDLGFAIGSVRRLGVPILSLVDWMGLAQVLGLGIGNGRSWLPSFRTISMVI